MHNYVCYTLYSGYFYFVIFITVLSCKCFSLNSENHLTILVDVNLYMVMSPKVHTLVQK